MTQTSMGMSDLILQTTHGLSKTDQDKKKTLSKYQLIVIKVVICLVVCYLPTGCQERAAGGGCGQSLAGTATNGSCPSH